MDGAAALTSSLRHSGRCTILYSCDSCLLQPCVGGDGREEEDGTGRLLKLEALRFWGDADL
jgi:hypothetical protein